MREKPSIIRRIMRLLFVTNLAAFYLLLREGKRKAFAYLHQIWTIYIWRQALALRSTHPLLLPEIPIEMLYPSIDLSQIELLHPLPRAGGVRVDELVIISAIVRHLKPKRLVEIGTAEGRTTLNLALHSPQDSEVITLDLPPDASPAKPESGCDYRQMGIPEPGVLFKNHPLSQKIRLILADSTKFDWKPYEGGVDFVFIDGAHDYESVKKDTENALKIVKIGGVILWHDYGVVDGVTKCLNEIATQLPICFISGTSLAHLRK
jgi:hypothetical protein